MGLAFFLAGAVLTAAGFAWKQSQHRAHAGHENATAGLSSATRAILQHLSSPVEIRYYSILDTNSLPGDVQAFAGRVDQLLSLYEQAGAGRLKVVRGDSANAALADGLKGFNIDKGDACFLGIAVDCSGEKEALPRLTLEWEAALESDLSRAIARAEEAQAAETPPAPKVDTAAIAAVKVMIPDPNAVTLEEGSEALRATARVHFMQAAEKMKVQLDNAEQQYLQALANQSDAAQRAAADQLRKIQTEGNLKLQQIASETQAEVAALEQLKKNTP
jgi:hypothetical protein